MLSFTVQNSLYLANDLKCKTVHLRMVDIINTTENLHMDSAPHTKINKYSNSSAASQATELIRLVRKVRSTSFHYTEEKSHNS